MRRIRSPCCERASSGQIAASEDELERVRVSFSASILSKIAANVSPNCAPGSSTAKRSIERGPRNRDSRRGVYVRPRPRSRMSSRPRAARAAYEGLLHRLKLLIVLLD